MFIVIFSSLTTTFLDVYSAGITIKNVLTRTNLRRQIVLAGVLGTSLAVFFPMERYEWFLLWIGATFFPAFAIMITDFFVVRRGYDAEELLKPEGRYWYFKGFNLLSITCWIFGFILYVFLVYTPAYMYIGATIPTIVLTALIYWSSSKIMGY